MADMAEARLHATVAVAAAVSASAHLDAPDAPAWRDAAAARLVP
jgi:hypothetical protein